MADAVCVDGAVGFGIVLFGSGGCTCCDGTGGVGTDVCGWTWGTGTDWCEWTWGNGAAWCEGAWGTETDGILLGTCGGGILGVSTGGCAVGTGWRIGVV